MLSLSAMDYEVFLISRIRECWLAFGADGPQAAGRWNWWAPKLLVRLHERIGVSEN